MRGGWTGGCGWSSRSGKCSLCSQPRIRVITTSTNLRLESTWTVRQPADQERDLAPLFSQKSQWQGLGWVLGWTGLQVISLNL